MTSCPTRVRRNKNVRIRTVVVIAIAATLLLTGWGELSAADLRSNSRGEDRFANFNGTQVHYKAYGEGREALVFIHGWSCNMDFWRFQLPAFKDKRTYKTILIDLPGHGQSQKPESRYTLDLFAEAVNATLIDAGVDRAVLVGHSSGGLVAREFIRKFPDKSIGLVLVDAEMLQPAQLATREAWVTDFVKGLEGTDYKNFAGQFVDSMFVPSTSMDVRQWIKSEMLKTPREVMIGAIQANVDPIALKDTPVNIPTLALYAARSGLPSNNEEYLFQLFPGLANIHNSYQVFEGVDHFLMMEQPEKFNTALHDFLSRNWLLGHPKVLEQGIAYFEPGRYAAWPANNGLWSWGNEILVGFESGWLYVAAGAFHLTDPKKPKVPTLARSLDGGQTWMVESPPSLLPPEQGGNKITQLDRPMDFTNPDFAMTLRFTSFENGASRFWYSNDRGHTWNGPYSLPLFGFKGVMARTDYIVNGPHDAFVFLTATKSDGGEGRPFCARTTDGGLTWKLVSLIGDEPRGFSIMPSTLRLSENQLYTAVRVKAGPLKPDDTADRLHTAIETYASNDNGATWQYVTIAALDAGPGGGNPPSLIKLKDGRFVLTHGYLDRPGRIMAYFSNDNGVTWSDQFILRNNAPRSDCGYVRSVQRPDGKIVSIYYWNDAIFAESFISYTIWDPGEL
jgi:pimeloyl-ACP methyl ester carboxylesterase